MLEDELERVRAEFYEGTRSLVSPLIVNDAIDVTDRVDGRGAVISVEAIRPELTLLVELGSGSDELCRLSQLRFASMQGGMTVNERLYAASVMDLFDQAVRTADRPAMIRILRLVGVDPPEATADPILECPDRYGFE